MLRAPSSMLRCGDLSRDQVLPCVTMCHMVLPFPGFLTALKLQAQISSHRAWPRPEFSFFHLRSNFDLQNVNLRCHFLV